MNLDKYTSFRDIFKKVNLVKLSVMKKTNHPVILARLMAIKSS